MKTILHNKKTGFYFQGVADWTARVAEAFDFRYPERVAKFVLAAGLNVGEMEVVFAFEDARYNIVLPLDERFGIRAPLSEGSTGVWPISSGPQSWAAALPESLCSTPKDALDPWMFPRTFGQSL